MKLEAVRGALDGGDALPLFRWLDETTPRMRATACKIAHRFGLMLREDEIDDAAQMGTVEAWKAIEGFRYYCPICRVEDKRHGSKLAKSYPTERGLKQHAARAHSEPKLQAPNIDRRVWYMIGSKMQTFCRKVQRERTRERFSLVVEGLDPAQRQALEACLSDHEKARRADAIDPVEYIELRGSLRGLADPVQRARAAALLVGIPTREVARLVSY